MGDGTSVPEPISNNDLYQQQQQQPQHRFPAAPPTQQGVSLGTGVPRHKQQPRERKPWLKPVSSLIRGIPQSKQQQQQQQQQEQQGSWSGRNSAFPPAVHMVPQQDTAHLSPGWRGPAAPAAGTAAPTAVVENATMQDREERPQQQRQGQLSFGRERSRSVSPRIVRGPFGTGLSSSAASHHPAPSPAAGGGPDQHPLYDVPRSHYRSRSDQIYPPGYDGRAGSGVGGRGFESYPASFFDRNYEQQEQHQHQQQQQQPQHYLLSTAAADAAVSAVPVPRDEPPTATSDPYRTPTAAGEPPPFWGEPGESPAKQQRNGTRPPKDPPRQQPKPQCLFRGCARRPTHAVRGERPTYCAEHSTPGMSSAAATAAAGTAGGGSKRNRCLMPGCSKAPRYALPGQKAEYCTLHKNSALHVDVKHPRCESELGCVRQPTFGWEGEKARFCSAHKVDGMLDVKNPRCGEPGCLKRPRYGEEGGRARFCAAHRFDDMVDLASRRSTGGASSGAKHCVSPAKRPRNGPRSIAHDSSAAAAAMEAAAAALPSSPAFGLRAAGGGGGRRGGGAPLATRGHTPAHAGGHRRATSESWIDFCPKRVFETTGLKNEDGAVDLAVPRHTNTTASRRARHHIPRTVNTSMAAVAATASMATSPGDSLSIVGGNGGNLSFDEGAELDITSGDRTHRPGGEGIATTSLFQAGGSGSGGTTGRGGWGSSGAACAGWLSSDRGDTSTASKAESVSIAALGGELAALAAAPISDASPLPSPGSASSPLAAGAASTSASASAPGTSSGFCFSSSPLPAGGSVSSAVKQEKQMMAPVATVTAPVTPQSSSDSINGGVGDGAADGEGGGSGRGRVGGGGGARVKGGGGRGHRFNASDYEASAILLECRSGMLSGEQRI
eukprot:g9165.t1